MAESIGQQIPVNEHQNPDMMLLQMILIWTKLLGDAKLLLDYPQRKKDLIRANAYYMNNREVFYNFINSLI